MASELDRLKLLVTGTAEYVRFCYVRRILNKIEGESILVFLVCLFAALMPRLSLIVSGASYADDWGVSYAAHLESYRPVAALELWFYQNLFGTDYLTYPLPKLLSAFLYALSLTILMRTIVSFGSPPLLFTILAISLLLHPIFNELILWGVLSAFAFATFLSVSGAAFVYRSNVRYMRVAGVVLMCLASAGHQLLCTVGACLVFIEIIHRGLGNFLDQSREELVMRAAMTIMPVLFATGIVMVMRYNAGIEDFASRVISFVPSTDRTFFSEKFYVFGNAFANLYQAPMGFLVGKDLAIGAFRPMALVPPAVLFAALVSRVGLIRSAVLVVAIPVVFILALSPLLATNATPTGFRILGTLGIVMVSALSVVLAPIWYGRWSRVVVVSSISLLAVLFISTSVADIHLRKTTWERDLAWLGEAKRSLRSGSIEEVRLCSWRSPRSPSGTNGTRGIVVSYVPLDQFSYSVWYTQFLAKFLRIHGIDASSDAKSSACTKLCSKKFSQPFGPHRIVRDPDTSSAAICSSQEKQARND